MPGHMLVSKIQDAFPYKCRKARGGGGTAEAQARASAATVDAWASSETGASSVPQKLQPGRSDWKGFRGEMQRLQSGAAVHIHAGCGYELEALQQVVMPRVLAEEFIPATITTTTASLLHRINTFRI